MNQHMIYLAAKVSKPQNSFPISDNNNLNFFFGPILQNLRNLTPEEIISFN